MRCGRSRRRRPTARVAGDVHRRTLDTAPGGRRVARRGRKRIECASRGTLMNEAGRVTIRKLPTGVPGLDEILGGGLPEYSFNIIAGAPGCGKTTLAHHVVFANATPERPALYFTVLGE